MDDILTKDFAVDPWLGRWMLHHAGIVFYYPVKIIRDTGIGDQIYRCIICHGPFIGSASLPVARARCKSYSPSESPLNTPEKRAEFETVISSIK